MKFALAALALSAFSQASPIENDKRLIHVSVGNKHKGEGVPFTFTSTFDVKATPDQVVDSENKFTGGLAGSWGSFKFGLNSHEDIICYNITLYGFRGDYESQANTATHIHQAEKGKSGPPRIAFPDPVGDEKRRSSIGCLKGPFKTGVLANGKDTGEGFTVKQIEENPAMFFADSHSSLAVPGAFRGQLDSGKVC